MEKGGLEFVTARLCEVGKTGGKENRTWLIASSIPSATPFGSIVGLLAFHSFLSFFPFPWVHDSINRKQWDRRYAHMPEFDAPDALARNL